MEGIDVDLEKTHVTFMGIHEVTLDIYTQHFGEQLMIHIALGGNMGLGGTTEN